jgi:TusA-related sulfurtransferase
LRGDDTLDTVGLYCPVPILKTAERIRTLAAGQVLEVLSDDRVILLDMPAWCVSTGHVYLGFREESGEWRLFVRKV